MGHPHYGCAHVRTETRTRGLLCWGVQERIRARMVGLRRLRLGSGLGGSICSRFTIHWVIPEVHGGVGAPGAPGLGTMLEFAGIVQAESADQAEISRRKRIRF